jgi:branched-chain amino acid transport system permease protein
LLFVFLPDIFASYLPKAWGPLPTLLFGVGAVLLARNPEGVISMNGRQLASAGRRLMGAVHATPDPSPIASGLMPAEADPRAAAMEDVR